MSELKINIHGRNDNNTITDKGYPKFEDSANRLKPTGGALSSKNVRVVFETSAVSVLFENIRWGRKYERGDVEQAGILIGNYYRDSSGETEIIWGDVVAVVPADPQLVNASFEAIDITVPAWQKMHEGAAEYRAENLQILGWYHTHLSDINTRFSSVDTRTQLKAFTYEYSFGVVFNPNQKKWSAFYGSDSKECVGEIILDEALEAKYGEPKIKIMQVSGDSELQEDGTVVHFDENGNPIQPIKHLRSEERHQPSERSNNGRSSSSNETSSVRHFFGQLLIGAGQRISQPKRNTENHLSVPDANKKNKPKIQIGKINKAKSTIQCRYITVFSDGKWAVQENCKCKIGEDEISKIIQRKEKSRDNSNILYGEIDATGAELKFILRGELDYKTNTQIRFTESSMDEYIDKLAEQGSLITTRFGQRDFVIVICGASSQNIEVIVITFRGGLNI